MRIRSFFAFITVFLLLASTQSYGQDKERKALEQRRRELQHQIKEINSLLISNKNKQESILTQVENLDKRIRVSENLIKVTNQEANLLTRRINTNLNNIEQLRKELNKLKEDYAEMIEKSYKSKSQQNRIMFLLSSESFLQAYKRLQYMKQYTNYRKQQGEKIKEQTVKLQSLNKELVEQRAAKEVLLAENRKTQAKLRKDKVQQQELIASIRKKEDVFKQQIQDKQSEISKIDKEIERLIKEAIAAENKKKGSSNKTKFELTPQAKALAANFATNKGKLPWPVKSGVIVMRFGTHPHPIVKTANIKSNGVRIETNENEPVKAVFKGSVFKIQSIRGANRAVFVKHGNYITIYNNLSEVFVNIGDEINTGTVLGHVARSTATNKPTLSFLMYKNTQSLNPAHWIYKM
ncbi:septal ring factor EnvC (AmiA/AmiB activator) [Mesonia hippocampi]|uniref:Septal ring factor EnvC (AmiA/AmiB activator) n=1 Tax=Mesonia hippocampi TaxID=1628250 RepID=A0A840EQI3_9FLAO|nr:peptidoglycan DD-metalloendopeptidase family protein [Mesonia hippocampi]MBB4119315.1 septal ring factor EnvC (AmiA/AmiB activator) [Mesonia hippocampi]